MILKCCKSRMHLTRPLRQNVPFVLAREQHALLMPIGDVHYGTLGLPKDKLRRHLQWGVDRGALFLGTGDMLDFTSESQARILSALRNSTKRTLDDAAEVHVRELFEILKPTKGRWLGLLGGNHGHTFRDGTNSEQHLADFLGADYLGDLGAIQIDLAGKLDVWIFVHHGLGGGRLLGSGLLRLEDMPAIFPQGSIYLMAHIHSKVNVPTDCLKIAPNGALYSETKYLARTGSWQRGYLASQPLPLSRAAVDSEGTYIEKTMRRPAALGGLVFGIGRKWNKDAEVWVPDIHCSV